MKGRILISIYGALADGTEIGGGSGRLEERLRILDESLAEFRRQRGP